MFTLTMPYEKNSYGSHVRYFAFFLVAMKRKNFFLRDISFFEVGSLL